jgi:hypothetical protein
MAAAAALTAAGAMASGIAGIASASTNYRSQNKINQLNYQMFKEQQKYDKEMYEQQLADTWEMWNATNEYNSASNQVSRLKEAGLNPAMMLGLMNAGSASTSSTPSLAATARPNMQAPQIDPGRLMESAMSIFGSASSGIEKFQQLQANNQSNQARDIDLQTQAYRNMLQIRDLATNIRDKNLRYDIQKALKESAIKLGQTTASNAALQTEVMKAQLSYQNTQNAIGKLNLSFLPAEKALGVRQQVATLQNTILDGKVRVSTLNQMAMQLKQAGIDYELAKQLFQVNIDTAKATLQQIQNNKGPNSVAGLASALLTGAGDVNTSNILDNVQSNVQGVVDWLHSGFKGVYESATGKRKWTDPLPSVDDFNRTDIYQ